MGSYTTQDGMLDGMIIRVACKVKNLQTAIDTAWAQAEAKKYPHA